MSRPTALLTGATGGIGVATAQLLADRGVRLLLHCHRRTVEAERLRDTLVGGGHEVLRGDLADAEDCDAMVRTAIAGGGVDILINNAGIFREHPPLETGAAAWREYWDQTLAVNLLGPACLSHALAPHLGCDGRAGRIVNVSSRGAFRGEPTAPAYGASKAGLNALGQSLAQALAPAGVSVFTVAPGFVATEMAAPVLDGPRGDEIRAQSPMGRVAEPGEVAGTVVWLALDAPAFLTGCIIDVNGASYLRS
jgi:NAD(P)-dependent dehydrogenase (short-subunit alcohol dehydrogenase family)